MSQERKVLNEEEILNDVKTILTYYYEGREDEIRSPVQLQVLYTYLQEMAYEISQQINELYKQLGVVNSNYIDVFYKQRLALNDEYDLDRLSEKKIEHMCIQMSKELQEIMKIRDELKCKIKGLENKQKYLGLLNASLKVLIEKAENEWKYVG